MIPGLALLFLAAAAPEFTVTAPDGASASFADLRGEVTVVAFTSVRCPVSGMYQQRLNRMYNEFSAKGVKFVVLNANANETLAEVRKHSREASLPYPVYKDFNNRAADVFGAQTTPEVFVLDHAGAVRFHGAIDDSSNEARVKVHALRDALMSLLAGKDPAVSGLKAFGCVLKRAQRTS